MIDPYLAVGLQTKIKHVATRPEVEKNLVHIGNMIDMATHMCSLELPVRLIALGEGAIQGFVDEIMDMDQAEYAATMAGDHPLGEVFRRNYEPRGRRYSYLWRTLERFR